MSTSIIMSDAVNTAVCNAVCATCTAGSRVDICDGADVLVSIDIPTPNFGTATGGVATMSGLPISGIAVRSGTADLFRVYNGASEQLWIGVVGESGSGQMMELVSVTIATAQIVKIVSWTHSVSG